MADNLLCWLRYDVLRNTPNRGYESLMQDIKAIGNKSGVCGRFNVKHMNLWRKLNKRSVIWAIGDLWSDQCCAGLFPEGALNPRKHPGVTAFISAVSQRRNAVEQSQYRDVGDHGLDEGYSKEKKEAISIRYLELTKQKNHSYMASRCDFLLSHAIMGRSEDLRNMDLKSLYSYQVSVLTV